ncbi:unnamed protein product, partial [Heterosigma akashiwo]
MLDLDWSHADIVYTSSICFVEDLMQGVSHKARKLKPGSRFITLKLLPET